MTEAWDWPLFGWVADVRPALAEAVAAGRPTTLATLYAVEGSAPRAPGAQMLFDEDRAVGFFSGGCIEADVALHAAETLADSEPRRLVYGRGSPFWDIRLVCGGRIEILLERLAPDDPAVRLLLQARQDRRPVTWLSDGRSRSVVPELEPFAFRPDPFRLALPCPPAWRLAVVGGDPTALAIADLGLRAGLEVALLRPNGPASPPPLAGVDYRRGPAGEALAALKPDAWTAVAVATHELEADEEALLAALASPAGYVGVLGSAGRLPERLARLRARGVPDAALSRLHAPIGLPLGGKSAWTVAVSVIGEILQTIHGEADLAHAHRRRA